MKKERIDKILQDSGFADSMAKARAMVMAGIVLVNERRVEKPSEMYSPEAVIRIKGESPESRYVSRGGLKLEAALKEFRVDPSGFACLDVGSSTGGFTDCLLQHGAKSVVAIDAGTNQLDWKLRSDPRVEVRENTNARSLAASDFREKFELVTIDVSFISLKAIIPAVIPLLQDGGRIIVLIKPQFEVARSEVGEGGIVREGEKHDRVVKEINSFAETCGLAVLAVIDSPILGAEGNKEFLALYGKK